MGKLVLAILLTLTLSMVSFASGQPMPSPRAEGARLMDIEEGTCASGVQFYQIGMDNEESKDAVYYAFEVHGIKGDPIPVIVVVNDPPYDEESGFTVYADYDGDGIADEVMRGDDLELGKACDYIDRAKAARSQKP